MTAATVSGSNGEGWRASVASTTRTAVRGAAMGHRRDRCKGDRERAAAAAARRPELRRAGMAGRLRGSCSGAGEKR
ncbi:hypothetical protein Syun_018990 [Stephania yunnanensis]|uniref:Uncharacterized protein n=1 Tax=Stephania yunnanensis TaxID=152371 RepID=A0AAP0NWA6_9MAGN